MIKALWKNRKCVLINVAQSPSHVSGFLSDFSHSDIANTYLSICVYLHEEATMESLKLWPFKWRVLKLTHTTTPFTYKGHTLVRILYPETFVQHVSCQKSDISSTSKLNIFVVISLFKVITNLQGHAKSTARCKNFVKQRHKKNKSQNLQHGRTFSSNAS